MKIFFLGCGNMGEAFLKSGLEKNIFLPKDVLVLGKTQTRKDYLKKKYGVNYAQKIEEMQQSDIIFLGVKPQNLEELPVQNLEGKIVISILAGSPIIKISEKFQNAKIVRTMPNLGQFVNAGMSGMFFDKNFTNEEKKIVKSIFTSGGKIVEVHNEEMLDAVTAISGSGPAYFFNFVEKLELAAQKLGFSNKDSELLAKQTFFGSADILKNYPADSAEIWKKKVCSKGGTTEKAIENFENSDFEKIIFESAKASMNRAKELG